MFIVHLAGHLGKDPETRFTPGGQKVTTFSIATNHRKGKEDVTIWVRVTIWGDRFDRILPYLKKGSAVIVVGKMNPPSSYTDKEGRNQISLEVVADLIEFSPFGKSDRPEGQQAGYNATAPANSGAAPASGSSYDSGAGYMSHQTDNGFQATPSNKGNSYGGTQAGQGGNSSNIDDDTLPF